MATEIIRQDYLNGLSYTAIAEKYQIDARTARRYVELNLPLSELEHRSFPSVLDPYKEQIRQWMLTERPYARTVHRWLLAQGCKCSYTLVSRFVQQVSLEYEHTGIYSVINTPQSEKSKANSKAGKNTWTALKSDNRAEKPSAPKTITEKATEEKKYVNSK